MKKHCGREKRGHIRKIDVESTIGIFLTVLKRGRSARMEGTMNRTFLTTAMLTLALLMVSSLNPYFVHAESLPSHWDWRELGKVTPVKNLRSCSSCAAFAAVAAVESKILILENIVMDLSEQQLVSCGGGVTCSGGLSSKALTYIRDHGLVSEECFPYMAANVACSSPCQQTSLTKIKGFYEVSMIGDLNYRIAQIKEAIYKDGPVVAYLDIYSDFYKYSSGIYSRVSNAYSAMYALLLVGWDDEGGYWIAKNSWGPGWGESGFVRIAIYTDTGLYKYPALAVLQTDHNLGGVWDGTSPPLTPVVPRFLPRTPQLPRTPRLPGK